MEKIEFRRVNPSLHRLTYFKDNISIARSEMIRMLGKPEKYNDGLKISLEMAIDTGDSVMLVPFEIRVPFVYSGGHGVIYGFTQCKIYTTCKGFSQQIKCVMEKNIQDMRKAIWDDDRRFKCFK